MSCTRSLLNHPSYESSTKLASHELANAAGELRIDDPHSRRLLTSNSRPKFGSGWTLNELNTPCPEQRHDLLQAIRRRIGRDHGEFEISLFRRRPHLLHADDDISRAHAEPDEPKQPVNDGAIHESPLRSGGRSQLTRFRRLLPRPSALIGIVLGRQLIDDGHDAIRLGGRNAGQL